MAPTSHAPTRGSRLGAQDRSHARGHQRPPCVPDREIFLSPCSPLPSPISLDHVSSSEGRHEFDFDKPISIDPLLDSNDIIGLEHGDVDSFDLSPADDFPEQNDATDADQLGDLDVADMPSNAEADIRMLSQGPEPRCWDHGCHGRLFSNWSNLVRHQREKAALEARSTCRQCNTKFKRARGLVSHRCYAAQ
ncbi:hypothetical protein GQ53DRAFT_742768 [Thozetella sp. PMI_491]|nr:hypothetical protein GQ53DRAFT_742768 [Thozetella sp. PMI_491]